MNIDKYYNDGWGISKKGFLDCERILDELSNFNKNLTIVEFGSGISSSFFIDYFNEKNVDGNLISYDDSVDYSTKIINSKLKLYIKNIVECNDDSFNEMFDNKKYDFSKMRYRHEPVHTRQKNCFYDVKADEIPDNINFVLLDGSHGNGRSIAYLHLVNKLKSGSYIFIDDYNHYDFVDRLKMIFNVELISENIGINSDKWNSGGNYIIFRIL